MKMRGQCIGCLMRRILMEINEVDPSREMEVMEACTIKLGEEFRDGVVSAECATKIHKLAYDMLGADPYLRLKKKSNEQALALFPRAEEFVEAAADTFKAAVLCSIIGNVLDYGIHKDLDKPDYLTNTFETLLQEGMAIDHTDRMKAHLEKADNVLFFPDNAGEIIFDRLLVREIKGYDVEITMVPKEEPILTDVTVEDVTALGLNGQVDKVMGTGGFAVGFPFWNMTRELRAAIEGTDFIISKGMGNYECFTEIEHGPIAYLMRTKCIPVAEALDAPFDKNVAMVFD
jgi:uncharacterized protein with ATP-grasp and redox domains